MKFRYNIVFLILLIWIFIFACSSEKDPAKNSVAVSEILGDLSAEENFARAIFPVAFHFPKDLGMHPKFRNEWWYFTGNLTAKTGEKFGYQLTFFRTGLSPNSLLSTSDWRSSQIFMAHFAVSDIENDKFYFSQRFSRLAVGLAGVESNPFKVWLEDWSVTQIAESQFELPILGLRAEEQNFSVNLKLQPIKPIVLNGDNGLSQKGKEKGNASYYYSFTRLTTTGTVRIDGQEFSVTGFSWLDREWSTSALSKDQVGWDWFSLQFDDGTEMIYYQIRQTDGTPAPQSQGVFVDKTGNVRKIKPKNVKIRIKKYWKSSSGRKYPLGWELWIDQPAIHLEIEPAMKNQEITGFVTYWEGSVAFTGEKNGKKIQGRGYAEMTGY